MGSEMTPPTAIEKLLAWQRVDKPRCIKLWNWSDCYSCSLSWHVEAFKFAEVRGDAPTLDAAIEAALGAFREREKGRGT